MDVTSRESIQNAADKIKADYTGLDILINNAGIMYSPSKVRYFPLSVEFVFFISHYENHISCHILNGYLGEAQRVEAFKCMGLYH